MAENEFEKTVKLPASPSQAIPPSPPQNAPQTDSDKTVKLSVQDDKTVKLQASEAISPPAPAPSQTPPPQSPPSPPPPPAFISSPKAETGKAIWIIAGGIIVLLAAASWLVLPPWLKGKAEHLSKKGNHSEASKKLKMALSVFPLKFESYLILLGREQRLSLDFSNAEKSLEKILARNPGNYEAARELGLTLRESGDKQKALESFQKCLQFNSDDVDVLQWSAALAFELRDFNTSSSLYGKLTKAGQGNAEDWHHLGSSYYELGKMEEAKAALVTASQKDKGLKGAQGLLARIYLSQNKFDEALGLNKMELSRSPNDPVLMEALAESAWQAGTNAASKKKRSEAIRFFEEGVSVSSKRSSDLNFELAKLYSLSRKKKEALSNLMEALKGDPGLKSKARKEPAFAYLRKSLVFQKIVR